MAQEEGGDDPEPARAAAYLELGSGLGLLRGEIMPLVRGSALVTISPSVRVGGGGTVFPGKVEVEGDLIRPDRDLGFGYGGALVEVGPESPSERGRITVQTLIGAGGVEVRDRQTGTRLASDNVVVLEPAIVFRWGGFSRLDFGLSASWRAVLGGEDVDGVGGGDLSEPALVVQLRLGPL